MGHRFDVAWRAAIVATVGLFFLGPERLSAYHLWTTSGNQVKWQAGSPPSLWNNATQTLAWRLNTDNFPAPNLPSLDQAGAALQNSFQSLEDILGSAISFARGPNVAGDPVSGDGQFHVYFDTTPASEPVFGADITFAFAVTWLDYNPFTGVANDCDVVFNAGAAFFDWAASGPPAPFGSTDIEVTMVHEALHAMGLAHTTYFYSAVWPFGRFPEVMMQDRLYGPDDRVGLALVYPETPPLLGTITGTVTLPGPSPVNKAVVVAIDANGVPHGTQVTDAAGSYSIGVPPGTYDVTVHHNANSTYAPTFSGDVSFGGATQFLAAGFAPGVAVAAGATVSGVNVICAPGTTTMKLDQIGTLPGGPQDQCQFLPQGFAGTIRLVILSSPSVSSVAFVNFGPGITTAVSAITPFAGGAFVDVTADVSATAAPGVRNITLVRGGTGERLFLPGYIMVLGSGTLALAPGANNPPSNNVAPGATDHVMLQAALTAGPEDVRLRHVEVALAGSGPSLPDVKLWRDVNDNGTLEAGTDVRVLTSAAYVLAVPDETKTGIPGGTVVFPDVAVPVLAGRTVNLLVTADMPASGSGSYSVSLSPAGLAGGGNPHAGPHGMFWGDVIAPAGSAVGNTQTLGSVGLFGLGQFDSGGGNPPIAVGGSTSLTSVQLRGTVTTTGPFTVGLEVEVRPLGTPFTGTATASSPVTFADGSTISVTQGGLAASTSYHWQARGVNSSGASSPWSSFGSNAESEADFSVDTSTSSIAALEQRDSDSAVLSVGGSSDGAVLLGALVSNSGSIDVRLEVEVVPAGGAFADVATLTSAYVPSGSTASVSFSGATGDYRWQARSASRFGAASAWSDFAANGTLLDFHVNAIRRVKAEASCSGSVAAGGGGAGWLGAAAALLLSLLGRRARAAAGAGLVLLAAASAAGADDGLPRSLAEQSDAFTLGAYAGVVAMDFGFDSLGEDFIRRELEGGELGVAGLEALAVLSPGFRLGVGLEGGIGKDVRILGGGPLAEWRFAASSPGAEVRPALEHFLRAGVYAYALEVDKSDFGDFKPGPGGRAGYELRAWLGGTWTLRLGAEYRYARWDFDGEVRRGDESVGGHGFAVWAGVSLGL